jgi:hypothetical protein
MLDDALCVVRNGGSRRFFQAWASSAPLALCVLAIYYLERVEGVRSLRPIFALLLVLAFYARAMLLGRVARGYALAIRPSLPVSASPARFVDIACTASIVGLGLWVWLWPLFALCALTPFAVAAVLPFMALRGAVAPSWLARAASQRERGFPAFVEAFDDTSGMRGVFLIVELLALFGTIALFGNLYALMSFGLLLGHSLVGLDVAFVSSFISPDNSFVLLLLAATTLVLMEPLRAAISAQAFVDARSRRDGADLHAAIDAVIAQDTRRSQRLRDSQPPVVAVLFVLACCGSMAPLAHAVPNPQASSPDALAVEPEHAADQTVRDDLSAILAQREFRDFADQDSRTMRELMEKLFKWLDGLNVTGGDRSKPPSFTLPPISPWVPMTFCVIVLGLVAFYLQANRASRNAQAALASEPDATQSGRESVSLLDQAAQLAALGDLRGALRLLYLATLFALDRAHLIEYEPSKTNWQYTRSLPQGELRQAFGAFTAIFDRKWYGHELASLDDYEQCRRLADRIRGAERA